MEFNTGPVYLKMIIQFIEESTPKSSTNLVNKLQKLAVTDYYGDNVRVVCYKIKGDYEVLSNQSALPKDFPDIFF